MKNPVRLLARPMLASMFIVGGLDALKNPGPKVPAAKDVTDSLAETADDLFVSSASPTFAALETEQVIQANGAAQVLGGLGLASGKFPRMSAALLAGSLVPTTLAGHRFWEETDPAAKTNQLVHFTKNVSMLGGLLLSTFDREGEPSAAWKAHHTAEHVGIRGRQAKREAKLAAKAAKAEARAAAAEARTAAKYASAGAGLAAAATSAKAKQHKAEFKQKKAEATTSAKLAKQRAKLGIEHQLDTFDVRKELVKKQLTPDVADAKRLISSIRSDN